MSVGGQVVEGNALIDHITGRCNLAAAGRHQEDAHGVERLNAAVRVLGADLDRSSLACGADLEGQLDGEGVAARITGNENQRSSEQAPVLPVERDLDTVALSGDRYGVNHQRRGD